MNWISVKERLPEIEENVLFVAHTDGYNYVYSGCRLNTCWLVDYAEIVVDKSEVTHWRPLPEPPKEAEWISAEDQPPIEEVTLLGINEYGAISTGEAYNGVWRFDNEWMADDEVKYWMTLPKPPEHLIKRRKEYE